MKQTWYNKSCRDCPRLAGFLDQVAVEYKDYFCRPVPPFGDPKARLLIVGLAPGKHGANATGRPFTGDFAGILLYRTLHAFGFASAPESESRNDGLQLIDCRITNAVKCLPPENKPTNTEVNACNHYLRAELADLSSRAVILALGGIAHKAILKTLELKQSLHPFGHGNEFTLESGATLLSSYHCSRYNTQTRRLNEAMFYDIFQRAKDLLK